jgi:hypothetical protein
MEGFIMATVEIEKTYTEEESRENTARQLYNWGPRFEDAAKAMDVVLAEADGSTCAWIARVLGWLISSGKLLKGSWMLNAVERQRAMAEAEARNEEELAMAFIRPLLMLWTVCLLRLNGKLSKNDLRLMQFDLDRVRPSDKWAAWAKKALERAIRNSHPELYDVSIEFASEIKEAIKEHRAATVLIDCLIARVRALMEEHRQRNARETNAKQSARRSRQLARANASSKK